MSFEEEWPLAAGPTLESLQGEVSRLCRATGAALVSVDDEGETLQVTLRVPVQRAASLIKEVMRDARPLDEIRGELDLPRGDFDAEAAERAGCAVRETVAGITSVTYRDPERFTRIPDFYTLVVDVDSADPEEDIPARVSIYSNRLDNREGWNIAVALAGELAERLGILPDRALD